jgi:hypothetical protein
MLTLDRRTHQLQPVSSTNLEAEGLLERYDLQQAIVNSWPVFCSEIGSPELHLVGQEVRPHEDVGNSIDLLAFDLEEKCLVVIELKRGKNKLQLLQSLSYAAMVRQWDVARIRQEAGGDKAELEDKLTELEQTPSARISVKIIMIAESYEPEVIITADWLVQDHELDITAFKLSVHGPEDETILSIDQIFPLTQLAETYNTRRTRGRNLSNEAPLDWEEVLAKVDYADLYGRECVQLCQQNNIKGDPQWKRFTGVRTNFDGFAWVNISLRIRYLSVYIKTERGDLEQYFQERFTSTPTPALSRWREGCQLKIENREQYDEMVAWLGLQA